MLILLDSNCNAGFLHIPKTGGTYVAHIIKKLKLNTRIWWLKHDTLENMYKKNVPHEPRGYTFFTFIRHPVSWYDSYWRFRELGTFDPGWEPFYEKDHPTEYVDHCGKDAKHDYNKFVELMTTREPGFYSRLVKSYIEYEDLKTAYIGYQEHLAIHLVAILREVGIRITPQQEQEILFTKRVHKSEEKDLNLSPEMYGQILKVEHDIISSYYEESGSDFRDYRFNPDARAGNPLERPGDFPEST